MTDDTPDNIFDQQLLDIEAILRDLSEDDLIGEAPPASVWAGIQAQVGSAPQPAGVASLAEHRARRAVPARFLAAAAAVVLVVGAAVVAVAVRGGDDDVVATAQLVWDGPGGFDPLGADATATAELVRSGGGYELVLADADLPTSVQDADLELWLISLDADGNPADVKPVALVDPTAPGTYAVPAALDPETYTVVDISIEPRDGDAAHSGKSILRGQLSA